MRKRSRFDVILIQVALLGAVAAFTLVGLAALHYTQLDTIRDGKGPFHDFVRVLAISVMVGALSLLVLIARRWRRL